jgi:hypothetical protein
MLVGESLWRGPSLRDQELSAMGQTKEYLSGRVYADYGVHTAFSDRVKT